jgi:epsilon-lactone hydrolase
MTKTSRGPEVSTKPGTIHVDYRLAPENPYPAALEDAVAAYRELLDSGLPTSRSAIAGESAGAGLAAATLVALNDAGLPQLSSAFLMSPWADLTLSEDSITEKAPVDPALTPRGLERKAADYIAGGDATDGFARPHLRRSRRSATPAYPGRVTRDPP